MLTWNTLKSYHEIEINLKWVEVIVYKGYFFMQEQLGMVWITIDIMDLQYFL